MNIYFKQILVENFRSIEKINLYLNSQGTVIVKGINNYEETASSNGSGKSSIFEAIVFALFEETSSGEKDVSNRITGKGYNITLDFEVDGVSYIIIRTQQGSKTEVKLIKNGQDISARNKTDTNKLILGVLGINKDIFLDSILLSQNVNTNLATLSPTARKERLELLTSTNIIIDNFKEKIKEKQITYEQKCTDAQLNISKLTGNKETIQQQINQTQYKINQTREVINQKQQLGTPEQIDIQINELEKQIETYNNQITGITNEINNTNLEMQQITTSLDTNNKLQESINTDLNTLVTHLNQLNNTKMLKQTEINNNSKRINELETEITNIQNSDTCPTCGRKYENFDDTHIKQTIKEKQTIIKDLENNNNSLNNQIVSLNGDIDLEASNKAECDRKLADNTNCINKIQTEQLELNTKIQNLNRQKDMNYQTIQNLQNTIATMNNKKQELSVEVELEKIKEYENTINELNTQIKQINKQVELYNNQFTNNNNYVEVCKNIVQLITKEFRTFLLKNSINYLNNLLENYSKHLFSNDKDVIYIEQGDNKLNIKLDQATYESLSGGEKTKVDIALLLAQKSLASTIGNISSNIIILDEVLKFCDGTAEINIVDLIIQELDTLESIYMISHREIPIGYDKQLVVIKDKKGLSNLSE